MYHSKKENEKTYWKSYYFSEIDKIVSFFLGMGKYNFGEGLVLVFAALANTKKEKDGNYFIQKHRMHIKLIVLETGQAMEKKAKLEI